MSVKNDGRARGSGRERKHAMMIESDWDRVGVCLGDGGLDAQYDWSDERGWQITYKSDGATIVTSAAPLHPSLSLLGPNAAGQKRVIEVAFDMIDQFDDAIAEYAERVLASR